MPDYFYTVDVVMKNIQKKLITIVMIDTNILCRHFKKAYNLRNKLDRSAEKHWVDLERILRTVAASNVPYKSVSGHHPIYSVGIHGSTQCLIERLLPLLLIYKVQLYLSGHDHNLQHLDVSNLNSNVDLMIVGSGGKLDGFSENFNLLPSKCSKFFGTKNGFLNLEISQKSMVTHFIDQDGNYLYSKSFSNKQVV